MSGIVEQLSNWRRVGECIKDGQLVLSPFDQPIEEERRSDQDQIDDDRNFTGSSYLCESMEPEVGSQTHKIDDMSQMPDNLSYFLDGSIRTKYVGEYVEGPVSFPLVSSEVAVAVIKREGSKLRPFRLLKNIHIIFPHKDTGLISDTTFERLSDLGRNLQEQGSSTRIDFLVKSALVSELRSSIRAKARAIMHDLEHEVATSLETSETEWLVMDGAIRSYEFAGLKNTIGLAKSFSRKPFLECGGKQLSIPSYMTKLKQGERSAIFRITGTSNSILKDVAFWYVRLRTFPPMEPLGGIVKVDINLSRYRDSGLDMRDDVNRISSELYSMRFPSVYPWPRWPNYIYPIRVAEMYMNSSLINPQILNIFGREIRKVMDGV